MRDLHELLVIFLPHLHFLLPQAILADDQGADAFCNQQIDNPTACRVQIVCDAAIALRRDAV